MNLNASNQTPAVNVPMFNVVIFEICTFGHVKIDVILIVKFSVCAQKNKQLNFDVKTLQSKKILSQEHERTCLSIFYALQIYVTNFECQD